MQTSGKVNQGSGTAGEADEGRVPLPTMRKGNSVAALAISDMHLTERAPVCRAERTEWFKVQEQVLGEVSELQRSYNCPVLIAGDVFNKWDSSAWLINFALVHMPKNCYAIPGNHDLPNHLYTESFRSAYWTLVEAGCIKNLTPASNIPQAIDSMLVTPFPCGFQVKPPAESHGLALNIALIHDYIWTEKTGYEGAPIGKRYASG
jgi:hypothetical protein